MNLLIKIKSLFTLQPLKLEEDWPIENLSEHVARVVETELTCGRCKNVFSSAHGLKIHRARRHKRKK